MVAAAVVAAKMNLQHQIKRRLSGHRFFESDAPIVVAVSGGVDSMVLMDVMQHLTDPGRLIIAHVNHELRAHMPLRPPSRKLPVFIFLSRTNHTQGERRKGETPGRAP